uniref:cytochrome c oxidase subunit III n=1 Tax=Paranoplocephala sp. RKZ13 TaxID=2854041 RepID=UPI001F13F87F|nr:cytochrome c oxidase subunit III [Paranoplocephala sp. RKZ13]UKS07974.1 cytochrome c oxidase subunit III [Paranoplocephala sp. RKZ13]
MSIFPVFISMASGLLLVSLFFWSMWVLLMAFILFVFCLVVYLYDMVEIYFSYESGFWLFVTSEAIIFGTLIFCCLYFDLGFYESLSSALELPFLGCFLLLGSSITVTGFHHILGWRWAWVALLLTVLLGSMFVVLQVLEMNEAFMSILDSSFYACSFCTVGLHFSHVILGIIGLVIVLVVGVPSLGVYRCSVITWYWHFVDYIWLFVYTFVYVC